MNARGEQRWNCLHLQYMYQFLYLFVGLAPSGVCLSTADYAVTVGANSTLWSMCLRAADCVGEEKLKVGKAITASLYQDAAHLFISFRHADKYALTATSHAH